MVGIKVVTGNGASNIYLFFNNINEIIPNEAECPVVAISNGNWNARNLLLTGTAIAGSSVIVFLNAPLAAGDTMRINYVIDYAQSSVAHTGIAVERIELVNYTLSDGSAREIAIAPKIVTAANFVCGILGFYMAYTKSAIVSLSSCSPSSVTLRANATQEYDVTILPAYHTATYLADLSEFGYVAEPQVWFQPHQGAACVSVGNVSATQCNLWCYNPTNGEAPMSGWLKLCEYQ